MSLSIRKTLVLGATAGVLALASAVAPAVAKGKHDHHRHHLRIITTPVIVSSGYAGCDYYYWKWKKTGVRLWRSKYIACIG